MIRHSLRVCSSLENFVSDLHQRVVDMLNLAVVSGKEVAQKDMDALLNVKAPLQSYGTAQPAGRRRKGRREVRLSASSSDGEGPELEKVAPIRIVKIKRANAQLLGK